MEETHQPTEGIHNTVSDKGTPSPVVHVRNLPSDCTDNDLYVLCCPFGKIQNCLLLKAKKQGLVEMATEQASTALVRYYAVVPATIRGRTVYFQYSSKRSVVKKSQDPSLTTPSKVLLASVMLVLYPLTIDILKSVFEKAGTVEKLVIFTKRGNFQVLVQYADLESAERACQMLNGQNIYTGCCALRIQYSSLMDLEVKYNDEKSWDYTNALLPSRSTETVVGDHHSQSLSGSEDGGSSHYGSSYHGDDVESASMESPKGCVAMISDLWLPGGASCDDIFRFFSIYGKVQRVKIMFADREKALVEFATPSQCLSAIQYTNEVPVGSRTWKVSLSRHPSISMPRKADQASNLTKDYTYTRGMGKISPQPPSCVLYVSMLPLKDFANKDKREQTDVLLSLLEIDKLGLEAPPIRVKMLQVTTGDQSCLIETSSISDAVLIISQKNFLPLGKRIEINFASH